MKMSTKFDEVFTERLSPTEGSGVKSNIVIPVMISALRETLGSQKSKINNVVSVSDRREAYMIDIDKVIREEKAARYRYLSLICLIAE